MSRRRRPARGVSAPLVAWRRVSRDPAVRRVQTALVAVVTASWVTTVSLTVVAYDAGGTQSVALAVLVRAAAAAALGPAAGALLDRAPRSRSMFWAAAAGAAATVGAALAGPVVVPVVALTTVVAVAVMVFRAALSAVLPEMVDDPADLTAANVLSSGAESVGLFAGPALAGLLLALHGPRASFAVAAVLCASACAALTGTRVPRQSPRAAGERVSRASTRELLRLAAPRLLLLLTFAQTTVGGGVVVLSAALVVGPLDSSIGAVGALNAAFGLGCLVGSFGMFALAGSSRLGVWTSAALLLWGAPLLLVPVAPGLAVAAGLLVAVGIGNVMFDVTAVTLLQRAVPRRLTGRAFGVLETVVVLGVTAGALVAPPLDRLMGPALAFLALGACLVLVSLAGLRPLRRLDRELAAPAAQVALLQRLAPFALLPTPDLEALALQLRRQECASGDVVVLQGERGDTFFVVDSGSLAVAVDGRQVTTLGPGDSFGEIALLHDGTRTATVTARTPAVLWALEGSRFVATLRGGDGRALAATDQLVGALLQRARPGTDG